MPESTFDNDDLCSMCGAEPRWLGDPHKPSGWSLCVPCLRAYGEGMRRRRDAQMRLQPMADLA